MSDRETVLVKPSHAPEDPQVYHTGDCQGVSQAQDLVERPRSDLNDAYRECRHCSGDIDYSNSGGASLAGQIRRGVIDVGGGGK